MARKKAQALQVSAHDNQQSAIGGMQSYFVKNIPLWNPPAWQEASYWRKFVEKQPFASICRDTLANYLNSLDWMIVARDSDKKDELGGAIKHYTKLFERGNAYWWELDFSAQIEWFVKDLFTLPFGTAREVGRLDDNPNGRAVWLRPLDGGTLAPTLNFDFPVVQSAPGVNTPVYLQREYVNRVYLSPRTELQREGWGYAPPERIWRAIEMMSTGDNYYAQLLMDTPEAGLLDLGDMDESSAKAWIKGLQDLFVGVNPFKIPVLYEHEKPAQWIPFGRPPSELLYDTVTLRYAAILCAGYGLTLSDIGFPSSSGGGDTLAGTIRLERVGKSSGKAMAKKKFEVFQNQCLPPTLKFVWVDYDDERNVSKGRARLASAQAANIWITNRSFKPSEMRRQAMADGLVSIDLPEGIDENDPEFQNLQQAQTGNQFNTTRPSVNPSQGGQGQIIPQQTIQKNFAKAEVGIAKAAYAVNEILMELTKTVRANLSPSEVEIWDEYVDGYLTGKSKLEHDELEQVFQKIHQRASAEFENQSWIAEICASLVSRVMEVEESVWKDKAFHRAARQAEQDFIEGKSEDLHVEEPNVNLSEYAEKLHRVIFASLLDVLSRYTILASKSHLLQGKLEVDPAELRDDNIRVSRDIAKDVLQNITVIIRRAHESGVEFMESMESTQNAENMKTESENTGEQDAVS